MPDFENRRVKCYFLFNFEQVKDFADRYAIYEGAWYRMVLYYTMIHGIPDAIVWQTRESVRDEIVKRYGMKLLKKDGAEEYWIY